MKYNDGAMNKSIKFVYFDLGGVFFSYGNVFSDASKRFTVPLDSIDKMFDKYDDEITRGKITCEDFWDICLRELEIKGDSDFVFARSWVSDFVPIRESYDLSVQTKKVYPVGVLSNFYSGLYDCLIEQDIIPNIKYDQLVLSYKCGFRKPEPEIYQFAQEKLDCKPNEIFFIDDRIDFIQGAKDLGWETHLFDSKRLDQTIAEIKEILGLTE